MLNQTHIHISMRKSVFQIKFDNTEGLHYELLAPTFAKLF